LVEPEAITILLPIVIVSSILAAFLGVIYFIIFRRIWIVEDPLPTPGFEAIVKLLDIANNIEKGIVKSAKRSIRIVRNWSLLIFGLAFLRDFPIIDSRFGKVSLIDSIFRNEYYARGTIHMSMEHSKYTNVSFMFYGIGFAVGWFMRSKMALLICMGGFFTWFIVVPMVVWFNVPIYYPLVDASLSASNYPGYPAPAWAAFYRVAQLLAVGTILGAGITALIKMFPTIKTTTADMRQRSEATLKHKDWIPQKGWYEWPVGHIKPMMIITAVGIGLIFILGGFPILQSFAFSILLVIITFILGAIATKVGGEFGSPPVSGTSLLCLLLLILVFSGLNAITPFRSQSQLIIMALVGTTVFATAIALSSDVIWDFKVALYTGTRPVHIVKGELTGIFFGTFVSVVAAIFFSTILVSGEVELLAPQANAFATLTQVLMGGKVMYSIFFMGIIIGIFIELLTGLGTAFGIGMYFPLSYTLTFLVGGVARDGWTKKWLEPKAKENNWSESEKTLKLLKTYMIATGLFIGEAALGILLCFYYFFL
jgi:uncharacterized oligopeptide transporter (OPT) family protein